MVVLPKISGRTILISVLSFFFLTIDSLNGLFVCSIHLTWGSFNLTNVLLECCVLLLLEGSSFVFLFSLG